MIGRDYQELYVAICGEVLQNWSEGKDHEQNCYKCQNQLETIKMEYEDFINTEKVETPLD